MKAEEKQKDAYGGRVLNREQGTYKAERKRERERDKV